MKLTTHLYLMLMLGIRGAAPSCCVLYGVELRHGDNFAFYFHYEVQSLVNLKCILLLVKTFNTCLVA